MYKITKEIAKFYDELDEAGFMTETADRLGTLFFRELVSQARDSNRLTLEAEADISVTVSKAGPYAEAEFKLPVKDFDKFIAAAK